MILKFKAALKATGMTLLYPTLAVGLVALLVALTVILAPLGLFPSRYNNAIWLVLLVVSGAMFFRSIAMIWWGYYCKYRSGRSETQGGRNG